MLMKRLLIFIFLFPATIISFSQKELPPFGKADLAELRMKECSFEKEAAAMKLLDYQETEIIVNRTDIRLEVERRVRIKIFSKSGANAANINVPYVTKNRNSKISDVDAYIFNLDS